MNLKIIIVPSEHSEWWRSQAYINAKKDTDKDHTTYIYVYTKNNISDVENLDKKIKIYVPYEGNNWADDRYNRIEELSPLYSAIIDSDQSKYVYVDFNEDNHARKYLKYKNKYLNLANKIK